MLTEKQIKKLYFLAGRSVRWDQVNPKETQVGVQIIAYDRKTCRRKFVFTAPTRKKRGTACYVLKQWDYDAQENMFFYPEDAEAYKKLHKVGRAFAYLLNIGTPWDDAWKQANTAPKILDMCYDNSIPAGQYHKT